MVDSSIKCDVDWRLIWKIKILVVRSYLTIDDDSERTIGIIFIISASKLAPTQCGSSIRFQL